MSSQSRLSDAARHVRDGRRIVAEQKARILQMGSSGLDTDQAESLLDVFERTQAIFESDLRNVEAEMRQGGN